MTLVRTSRKWALPVLKPSPTTGNERVPETALMARNGKFGVVSPIYGRRSDEP